MTEQKKYDVLRIVAEIVMLIALGFLLGLTGLSYMLSDAGEYINIDEEWVDNKGNSFNLGNFVSCDGTEIYYHCDSVGADTLLVFCERNMFTDVYVNDKLVNEDRKELHWVFGSSPGSRWRTVFIEPSDEPVEIKLVGYNCYENARGLIFSSYIGGGAAVYGKIYSNNIIKFLISIVGVILGILGVLMFIITHKKLKLDKDYLYMSVGTLFCAIWCSTETTMWQFMLGHPPLVHSISYVMIFAIPVPFALLFVYRLKGKWNKAAIVYAIVAEITASVSFFLNVTGILEFHYTAPLARGIILLLFPFTLKLVKDYSAKFSSKIYVKIMWGGFAFLFAFFNAGIIYYLLGKYTWYSSLIRLALFCLLSLLFGYQFVGLRELFIKGLQTDFLKEQALRDHLTKFYNRAGFAEHRAEFDKDSKVVGVVQFDVNNLKQVNDTQGHEKGDELICLASSGIYQSFNTNSRCYRMGGDEFMVILTGADPESDYKSGIELLNEYCSYANSVPERTFDVKIANGFTVKKPDELLSSAMERADGLMYENKKWMKANNK